MLDPSMRLLGDAGRLQSDLTAETCAASCRLYLPQTMPAPAPYAAPLEVSRLAGLPPAFTGERDVLCPEAEKYASSLIRAGVPTGLRFAGITHGALRTHLPLLKEIVNFLRCRFASRNATNPVTTSCPSSSTPPLHSEDKNMQTPAPCASACPYCHRPGRHRPVGRRRHLGGRPSANASTAPTSAAGTGRCGRRGPAPDHRLAVLLPAASKRSTASKCAPGRGTLTAVHFKDGALVKKAICCSPSTASL
jgi:hypothetical protein